MYVNKGRGGIHLGYVWVRGGEGAETRVITCLMAAFPMQAAGNVSDVKSGTTSSCTLLQPCIKIKEKNPFQLWVVNVSNLRVWIRL